MLKIELRRFVSKLEGKNKHIFFAVLVLICIMAVSFGIYIQFFYKYADTDPLMIGINIGAQKTLEEYAILESNFNDMFQNGIKQHLTSEANVQKIEEDNELVYTAYELVNEDEAYYSVDAQIPIINIDSQTAKKINQEIKQEYYDKANSVMRQDEGNTIYKVTYQAFVNEDILSLVIRASLKEDNKSEKVSVKTYAYSLSQEEEVSIEQLIDLKKTTVETVQKNIDKEIKKADEDARIIANEYGTSFERNLESKIYKVDSIDTYFLTEDGYVYIIFPYGNEDYTNEMDIVIF